MKFKMKGRTRYEVFIEMFKYWAKKLGYDEYLISRDNRYNGHVVTEFEYGRKRKIQLKYNSRKLAKWSYALLLSGVFHEIGHIKYDLPYDTNKEQIKWCRAPFTFCRKPLW